MTTSRPELRAHQGQCAGIVSRFVANAVDLFVIAGVVAGIYLAAGAFQFVVDEGRFRWPVPGTAQLSTLAWMLLVIYLTLGWSGTGRTAGKQLLGLRVVDHRGHRVKFFRALVRALICVLFPVGLVWCAVSRERRSLADVILRTSVRYDWTHRIHP